LQLQLNDNIANLNHNGSCQINAKRENTLKLT